MLPSWKRSLEILGEKKKHGSEKVTKWAVLSLNEST